MGTPLSPSGGTLPAAPENTAFSLRIVTVDHYMSRPVEGLDIGYSGFLGTAIDRVPVLRIFGSTPAGQKVCLHLHTAFPYFFLPLDDDLGLKTIEQVDTFISRLATSLARAMDVSLGGNKGQYVYKIMPIKAKNFYGYHPAEGIFLKVFITNPNHLPHILRFLRSGAIMNRTFQPFEAHIPYQLQVFVDHNLYGMGLLRLSSVAFRPPLPAGRRAATASSSSIPSSNRHQPLPPTAPVVPRSTGRETPAGTVAANSVGALSVPASSAASGGSGQNVLQKVWSLDNVPRDMIRTDLPRLSKCEIEIDARCKDIVNLSELRSQRLHPSAQPDVKLVKSLASMWEEDRMRRVALGKPSQASPVVTPERADIPHFPMVDDALRMFERIISQDKAEDVAPSTSAATGAASAAPSHLPHLSPQLQAYFQDTPRASDPEAIFADHTPASGELSQVTQLNHDVAPEVNVELVLSQASDREMHDILNWMHDYESEEELNDEDDEDEEGDEKEGHQAGSQKEVEEIMASQTEVTKAEQSLLEKSAALLQEARKNSEAAKKMCKQLAEGYSQRGTARASQGPQRLDKGKEKACEGETDDEDEQMSDEELQALLRDIPQFDGADDEPPVDQAAATTAVPLKKRSIGDHAPKRSNKQPDLPPTVKYQAKLQKLDRYCNLFNLRATSADHRDAAPRREREKSKGRDRDGRKRTKEKKEKKKEKKKSEREKRREKERAKGKEKEKDRDNETRRKRKEDDERRNRDEEKERRDDDDKERRRTETDRGRGKTKTDRDERSRTRASEHPPPRKRGLSRGKKRVSPDTILAMLEDKKRPRVEAPTELDQATSATLTKSKPTSSPMTITIVSTTSTTTRRPVAPATSSSSSTILRSSRRVGATARSLSRRLQAKEDHATIEGAGVVADVGSRDARQADSARLGLVDEFKVPRGTTAPRSKAAPVGDDVITALLVPVTPDTSPEKPSQQRLRGSQGESSRARAQRGLDDEVTAQAAIANASESEPLFSPLSVVPQTPDSELWAHKERNTKKTKNETERTKTRSDLCGFGAKRQEEKKKREERSAKEESIVSAVENAKHADHEATQRKVVEEDSVDVIPETPEEQVRPPAKTVQRRKKERLRPKTISTLADKLDEGLEVVAETQMTAAMSTASMPHFAAVSLGSHASMPVTCAQAPSSSDEEASDDEDDIVTDTTTIQAKSASVAEKTNVNNAEKRKWPNDDGGDGDEEELSLHFSLSLWSPAASMAAPSQPFASARHRDLEEFLARNDHRPRRQPQTKRSAAVGQPQQPLTSSELSLPLLSAESPTKDLAGNGGIGQALKENAAKEQSMASEKKNEKRQSPEGLEEQASIEVSEELMVEASNALLVSTVEDDVTNPAPPAEKNGGLEQENEDEGEEDDEEKRRKKEMDEEEQVRVIRERMMQRKRDKREALQRQPSMDLLSCTPYPASARQVADKAAATPPPPPELLEPRPPQLALHLESIVEHAQIKPPEAVEAAIAENEALNDVAEPESVGPALLPTHEPLAPAGLYRWALPPPTRKEVLQALASNNAGGDILPFDYHPPFFSNSKDAPRQTKNIGGLALKLSVGELADIKEFDTAGLAALWDVESGPLAARREWPLGLAHYARVKAAQAKRVPIRITESQQTTERTTTHARPLKRRKRGHFYTPAKAPPTRAEVQRLLDIEKLFVSNDKFYPVAEALARKRKADDQQQQQQPQRNQPTSETWKHLKVVKDGAAGGVSEVVATADGSDGQVATGEKKNKNTGPEAESPDTRNRKRVRFEEIARNGQMPKAAAAAIAYNERRATTEERSQIERTTPAPGETCGFAVSGNGFRRDKPASTSQSVEQQHVTLMSIEVHVNTRADLRPNPGLDAVTAIFYCIRDDDPDDNSEMVGILVTVQDEASLFTTHGLDCRIDVFKDERAMLLAFAQLVSQIDPDILVGYEVQMASLGFIIERGYALKINLCEELSRMNLASVSNSHFDKKQDMWGYSHASGVHITGRMVLNVWRILRSELRLPSYSYQNTAYHVLHKRIPYYSYATMTGWYVHHNGSQRWRVLQHYTERVQHYLDMLQQMDIIGRTSEMARVYGIDFFAVLSRGSQYRVESMMIRLTKLHNYVLISPSRQQVASQAAIECIPLVMEPLSRFYSDPVIVLDFQSLYPSIVIAYNYCYSTCVGNLRNHAAANKTLGTSSLHLPKGLLAHLQDNIFVTPNEVMFVTKEVREGVLPRLLREILETRIVVKAAMKLAKNDKALYKKLNAQQFGLKMIANVTYGYTSANFSGRMPCVEIADSIVQTGRETLENAIRLVNNTRKWGANVIYGDTDSLFVCVPGATREQAFKVGREIAEAVTKANPWHAPLPACWPVTLQFEKVYHPCILLAKKRYVGYKYESVDQKEPTFEAKGIETVRRDTCPAVSKILEKSLRLLFEQGDISTIKAFVQRQWTKLAAGRVSLKDFIFAKEVKLGTYSTKVPAPPAALVCQKEMAGDPRAEPRYGERVPYVVVCGGPQARLMDLVVSPQALITNPNLRLNARYYIDKQIVPALSRVFALIGVDVKTWYAEMPRSLLVSKSHQLEALAPPPPATAAAGSAGGGITAGGIMPYERANPNRVTIDQYYLSKKCALCENLTKKALCSACMKNKQGSYYLLMTRLRVLEKETTHLEEICMSCCGVRKKGEEGIKCVSIDCEVFFERTKVNRAMHSYRHLCQTVLEW